MKDYENHDHLVIERAKGIHLYGPGGKVYYDTISSWWTNLHGHGHRDIRRGVNRQMKTLDHVNFSGFTHGPAVELAQRLRDHLPSGLSRFFYSDNGSTAVEVALKMAFQYFKNQGNDARDTFLYFDNSYHGDTLGAMSVSGQGPFGKPFESLKFSAIQAPKPCAQCASGTPGTGDTCTGECFKATAELLENYQDRLAAVIIEPLVQCVGGMWIHSTAFLRALVEKARSLNIMVIFDEVATGFGRTGTMFALDQAKVQPDFLCLSKGITGGVLPLAVTVTTNQVYEAFYDDYGKYKTFFHGHSYTANPVACAAGIASLEIFRKEKTLERVARTSSFFAQTLKNTFQGSYVGALRNLGMIGALDLVPEKGKSFPAKDRVGYQVYRRSLENGLVLRPLGDTLYWLLPLVVREKDIKIILERSRMTIEEVLRGRNL